MLIDNSADTWRHELMDFAKQVKSSLASADEQEQYLRQTRSSRFNKPFPRRSTSSVSNALFDDNDEQHISKRLLHRRISLRNPQLKPIKQKSNNEKTESESTPNDENQDPGIWVIRFRCHGACFFITTFFAVDSDSLLYSTNGQHIRSTRMAG